MKEYKYIYEEGKLPECFRKIKLLSSFDEKYLKHIMNTSRIREFSLGETIIAEGGFDNKLHVLLGGKLAVKKSDETIGAITRTGEIFGEVAMLSNEARSASVEAETKAICLVIDIGFLKSIPEKEQAGYYALIYQMLAQVMADRLRDTNDELAAARREIARLKKQGTQEQP